MPGPIRRRRFVQGMSAVVRLAPPGTRRDALQPQWPALSPAPAGGRGRTGPDSRHPRVPPPARAPRGAGHPSQQHDVRLAARDHLLRLPRRCLRRLVRRAYPAVAIHRLGGARRHARRDAAAGAHLRHRLAGGQLGPRAEHPARPSAQGRACRPRRRLLRRSRAGIDPGGPGLPGAAGRRSPERGRTFRPVRSGSSPRRGGCTAARNWWRRSPWAACSSTVSNPAPTDRTAAALNAATTAATPLTDSSVGAAYPANASAEGALVSQPPVGPGNGPAPGRPRAVGRRRAAGVRQLGPDQAAVRVHEPDDPRPRLGVQVRPDPRVQRRDAAVRGDRVGLRQQEPVAAGGPCAEVDEVPVPRHAVTTPARPTGTGGPAPRRIGANRTACIPGACGSGGTNRSATSSWPP